MKLTSFTYAVTNLTLISGLCLISVPASADSITKCTLGTACTLAEGTQSTFAITATDGTNFTCEVTATPGPLNFLLKGTGRYKITSGGGRLEANPTLTATITGAFKGKSEKPVAKGGIMFTSIVGGTGTVTCNITP